MVREVKIVVAKIIVLLLVGCVSQPIQPVRNEQPDTMINGTPISYFDNADICAMFFNNPDPIFRRELHIEIQRRARDNGYKANWCDNFRGYRKIRVDTRRKLSWKAKTISPIEAPERLTGIRSQPPIVEMPVNFSDVPVYSPVKKKPQVAKKVPSYSVDLPVKKSHPQVNDINVDEQLVRIQMATDRGVSEIREEVKKVNEGLKKQNRDLNRYIDQIDEIDSQIVVASPTAG